MPVTALSPPGRSIGSVSDTGPVGSGEPWLVRRAAPILSTLGVLAAEFFSSMWWGPHIEGSKGWATPGDLWRTVFTAQALVHLHFASLYTHQTALVTFPGALVVLAPVAALVGSLGLRLGPPVTVISYSAAWPFVATYSVFLSGTALVVADVVAERLGASARRRWLMAAAGGIAIWNVTDRWGHPEDCVAVALLLCALLALADGRDRRSGWLLGAAISVQPLVVLALPVVAVTLGRRRLAPWALRLALPSVVLLLPPLVANWSGTFRAIVRQPNYPKVDQPTPWIHFATRLTADTVSAGPGRVMALLVALACCWPAAKAWRRAMGGPPSSAADFLPTRWTTPALAVVLWWTALALSLRCGFEAVMVPFYIWPGVALALVSASRRWITAIGAAGLAVGLTAFSQLTWRSEWGWWSVVVAGLALLLAIAHPGRVGPHDRSVDDDYGTWQRHTRPLAVAGLSVPVSAE